MYVRSLFLSRFLETFAVRGIDLPTSYTTPDDLLPDATVQRKEGCAR